MVREERPVWEREVLTHLKCKFVSSRKLDLRRTQVKEGASISRKESFGSSKPTFLHGVKKSKEAEYLLQLIVKHSP